MISSAKIVTYTMFWLLRMYWSTYRWMIAPAIRCSEPPRKLTRITGSSRIELAKMIGITPDWLTLSGM